MNSELKQTADQLVRALGALGVAQELVPESPELTALTRHAEILHESLAVALTD